MHIIPYKRPKLAVSNREKFHALPVCDMDGMESRRKAGREDGEDLPLGDCTAEALKVEQEHPDAELRQSKPAAPRTSPLVF